MPAAAERLRNAAWCGVCIPAPRREADTAAQNASSPVPNRTRTEGNRSVRDLWFPIDATVLVEISGQTVTVPLSAPTTCPVCAHPMPSGTNVCRSCAPVVIR